MGLVNRFSVDLSEECALRCENREIRRNVNELIAVIIRAYLQLVFSLTFDNILAIIESPESRRLAATLADGCLFESDLRCLIVRPCLDGSE